MLLPPVAGNEITAVISEIRSPSAPANSVDHSKDHRALVAAALPATIAPASPDGAIVFGTAAGACHSDNKKRAKLFDDGGNDSPCRHARHACSLLLRFPPGREPVPRPGVAPPGYEEHLAEASSSFAIQE